MRRKNLTELDSRIEGFFQNARARAKKENVKFNLTREYIATIMTSHCPVFNTMFDWTPNLNSKRENNFSSPELDKVQQEYLRLAAALWAGSDPLPAIPMKDRDIFDLLGFD